MGICEYLICGLLTRNTSLRESLSYWVYPMLVAGLVNRVFCQT